MKLLRGILVFILAGLIVRGLWTLSQNESFSNSRLFSPLLERLTNRGIDDTNLGTTPTIKDPTPIKNENDVYTRISTELIPELTYGSLSTRSYSDLLETGKILGNQNADYLMIQYCDYSMTFCRQAERQGALIAYQDALNTNLGYMLKPVLLESNESSELQHHALICAQKTGNESQINRMYSILFDLSDSNDIRKAGVELGIENFETCLLETSSSSLLLKERSLARKLFEVKQLPSFVLIDTRTLAWTLIPGLYEEELMTGYLKQL